MAEKAEGKGFDSFQEVKQEENELESQVAEAAKEVDESQDVKQKEGTSDGTLVIGKVEEVDESQEVKQKEHPSDSCMVTEAVEEVDEGQLERKENPLDNSLILANIFKYMEVEDLKNVRLTCSFWLQESSKQWDSFAIYKIKSDFPYKNCSCQEPLINESQYHERTYSLQEFLAKWESVEPNQRQLMRRFRLASFLVLSPTDTEYRDFIRLLDLVGSNMTYLHLDHCTFRKADFLSYLKWILSKCLNLQELVVILSQFDRSSERERGIFPEQLNLPTTKHLKRFSFMCCKSQKVVYHYYIPDTDFRHLLKISPNRKPYDVPSFTVRAAMHPYLQIQPSQLAHYVQQWLFGQAIEDEIGGFVQNAFPALKLIMVVLGENDFDNEFDRSFPNFLTLCQNPLKELIITRDRKRSGGGSSHTISFSKSLGRGFRFPCLTHLCLTGEYSISFISLMAAPNLKSLHLMSALGSNWNQLIAAAEGEEILFDKLEDFYVDYFRFLPNSLRLLKRWMPNVKEFGVVVTPTTRPLVMELWPDLDKLVLIKGSVWVEGGLPILTNEVQEGVVRGSD